MARGRSRRRRSPMLSPRRPRSTARPSRSCPSWTRSSAHGAMLESQVGGSRRAGPAQTPQGARRELLLDAFAAAGTRRTPTRPRCSKARASPSPPSQASRRTSRSPSPRTWRSFARSRASRAGTDPAGGALTTRVGLGQDTHGFGPDMGLMLGGLTVRRRAAPVSATPTATSSCTRSRPRCCPRPAWAIWVGCSRHPTRGREARTARSCLREALRHGTAGRLGRDRRAGVPHRCPAQAGSEAHRRDARKRRVPARRRKSRPFPSSRRPEICTDEEGAGLRDQRNLSGFCASAMMHA